MCRYGKVDIKCLPSCSNSLEFHTKRANNQVAIWGRSLDQEVEMPRPVGCSWKQSENNELEIDWGSQPPALEDVFELLACHCSWACQQNQCYSFKIIYPALMPAICLTAKTSQLFIVLMAMPEMSVTTMTKAKMRTIENVFMWNFLLDINIWVSVLNSVFDSISF